MQLEFPFVAMFAVAEAAKRDFLNRLNYVLNSISLEDTLGRWARAYYRSGGIFLRFPDQYEFPGSEYW